MTKAILDQAQLDRLAAVIGEAEGTTSGEIRLMIVKRSTSAPPVAVLLFLLFLSLGMIFLWIERLWLGDVNWALPAVLGASILLAYAFSFWPRAQRLFTHPAEMRHAVQVRAELEFHREGLSRTVDSTGILLFLSLFERRAVVLADRGIASKLPPSTWNDVIDLILEGAAGAWEEKLGAAIRLCGAHLSAHFPARPEDVNELPNTVLLKD